MYTEKDDPLQERNYDKKRAARPIAVWRVVANAKAVNGNAVIGNGRQGRMHRHAANGTRLYRQLFSLLASSGAIVFLLAGCLGAIGDQALLFPPSEVSTEEPISTPTPDPVVVPTPDPVVVPTPDPVVVPTPDPVVVPVLSGVARFSATAVGRVQNDFLIFQTPYTTATATVGGRDFLFTAGHTSDSIHSFEIMSDGALLNRENVYDSHILEISGTAAVTTAVVGDRTFLFVAGSNDHGVSSFEVAINGTLLNRANVSDDNVLNIRAAFSLATANIGEKTFLFVAGRDDDGVSSFEVASDGTLMNRDNIGDTSTLNLNAVQNMETITIGERTFLFVAGYDDDGVSVLEINANGEFISFNDSGRNVSDDATLNLDGALGLTTAVTDNGSFLFVGGYADNGISTFEIGNDGTLTNRANIVDTGQISFAGVYGLDTISIGRRTFLFTAGSNENSISSFEVGVNGALTVRANIRDTTTLRLDRPVPLVASAIGARNFLFVASQNDNGISVFEISNAGSLTGFADAAHNIAGSVLDRDGPVKLGGAHGIATTIVAGTRFVFVSSVRENGISVFEVDEASGHLLHRVNQSDTAALALRSPEAVTTAAVGGRSYLFVAGYQDDGISSLEISNDGTLIASAATGRTITDTAALELDGVSALSIAEVNGNIFLIAASFVDDGVSVFGIDSDGALTHTHSVSDDTSLELDGAQGVTTALVNGKTFVFVAGRVDDGVSVFEMSDSGLLTAVQSITDSNTLALDGARGITTVVVNETTLLVVSGDVDDGVSVFSVDNSGMLTHLTTVTDDSSLAIDGAGAVATLTVDGATDIFVAGEDENGFSVFDLDEDGTLTHRHTVFDNSALKIASISGVSTAIVGNSSLLFTTSNNEDSVSVFR